MPSCDRSCSVCGPANKLGSSSRRTCGALAALSELRFSLGRVWCYFGSAIVFLSGCTPASAGLFASGENASYGAWTETMPGITDVQIWTVEANKVKTPLSRAAVVPALPRGGPGWGGQTFHADNGHKVPEEVEIRWRKWPNDGQKWYESEAVTPIRVSVRARLPNDALKMARESRYILNVSFAVAREPESPALCWRVEDYDHEGAGYIVRQGGQIPTCCNLSNAPEFIHPKEGCRVEP